MNQFIKFLFILFHLVGMMSYSVAQDTLRFKFNFQEEEIFQNTNLYIHQSQDSLIIEKLRFYISKVSLWQDSLPVYEFEQPAYLIDISKPNSLNIPIDHKEKLTYNKLCFHLGIDSTTQVKGALDGVLDPMNNMYWTWQSGYINFILEGNSNLCPTRKNIFTFHIGGYQAPYNTYRQVVLNTDNNPIVYLDLYTLLNEVDLTTNHSIMSPNKAAMEFSNLLQILFYCK